MLLESMRHISSKVLCMLFQKSVTQKKYFFSITRVLQSIKYSTSTDIIMCLHVVLYKYSYICSSSVNTWDPSIHPSVGPFFVCPYTNRLYIYLLVYIYRNVLYSNTGLFTLLYIWISDPSIHSLAHSLGYSPDTNGSEECVSD